MDFKPINFFWEIIPKIITCVGYIVFKAKKIFGKMLNNLFWESEF